MGQKNRKGSLRGHHWVHDKQVYAIHKSSAIKVN